MVTEVVVPSALRRRRCRCRWCRRRTRCGPSSRCRSRRRRRRWRRCRSCRRCRPGPRRSAGLSTSLMVSVPEVEMSAAALVSVRLAVSARQHGGVVGAEDVDGDARWWCRRRWRPRRCRCRWCRRRTRCGPSWRCRSRRRRRRWRTCRRLPTVPACGDEGRRAVDVGDGQRAGGRDVSGRVGLGQVAVSADSTAASLVPRMLTVTRGGGAVGAGDREGVGVGGAGDELVVGRVGRVGPGAGARRSRTCRSCRRCLPGPRRSPGCRRR